MNNDWDLVGLAAPPDTETQDIINVDEKQRVIEEKRDWRAKNSFAL